MFTRFGQLALLSILALSPYSRAEDAPKSPDSHWGFNLSLYTWLAGLTGNFDVGPLNKSIDASFFDIANQSRRFPIGFMGRFEAHYDRLGVFVDGTYMSVRISPTFQNFSRGLDSDTGLMDYGLTYRLVGPTADEIPSWQGKKRPNRLDVYAGARSLWLDNGIEIRLPNRGVVAPSSSQSYTSPIIGGRFGVDFTPDIFMMVDGNIGGFGVDNISFTGGIVGMAGYRLSAFDVPLSLQAGYKALRYQIDGGPLTRTKATLNGPFLGLTAYW